MNDEIAKMRERDNESLDFSYKPGRLSDDEMQEALYNIHTNYRLLYELNNRGDVDINEFASKTAENIKILLEMFNTMGVYPSLFFDLFVKMKLDYRKNHAIDGNQTITSNYFLIYKFNYEREVEENFKRRIYSIQLPAKKSITDAYNDVLTVFKAYGIPYGIKTNEQCSKVFEEVRRDYSAIANELENSVDIYKEIECMTRILYEYISFFVAMGIDPKEYLDKVLLKKDDHRKK